MGTAGFGKETLYEYEPSTDRAAYNRVLASANGVNQAIEQEIHRAWGRGVGPDGTHSHGGAGMTQEVPLQFACASGEGAHRRSR